MRLMVHLDSALAGDEINFLLVIINVYTTTSEESNTSGNERHGVIPLILLRI
jgi:hypothetical protein